MYEYRIYAKFRKGTVFKDLNQTLSTKDHPTAERLRLRLFKMFEDEGWKLVTWSASGKIENE